MKSFFSVKTIESTNIYFLTMEKLKILRENNEEIDKALTLYEFKTLRPRSEYSNENLRPLDVEFYFEKTLVTQGAKIHRENILKNIAYTIMIKNRISRKTQTSKFQALLSRTRGKSYA